MINTGVYDYINVLDKAADGSWARNNAIANNIACFYIVLIPIPSN